MHITKGVGWGGGWCWLGIYHLVGTNKQKSLLSTCRSTISGTVGSFQAGRAFASLKALTIESLLMKGCGQGHEP